MTLILQKHHTPKKLEAAAVKRAVDRFGPNATLEATAHTLGAISEAYDSLYSDVYGLLGNREAARAKVHAWATEACFWASGAEVDELLDSLGFSPAQLQTTKDQCRFCGQPNTGTPADHYHLHKCWERDVLKRIEKKKDELRRLDAELERARYVGD